MKSEMTEALAAGEYLVVYETTNAAGEWEVRTEIVKTGCQKMNRKYGETAFILSHKGQYPLRIREIRF